MITLPIQLLGNFVNRVINAKVDYNILQNLILGAHFANVQDKQDVPSYVHTVQY